MTLSKDFVMLISDEKNLSDLCEWSCSYGHSWETWQSQRKFLAGAFHKDGTVLDVGCANGFLLRCLQEWSQNKLEPFGIDINKKMIEKTYELFDKEQNHFSVLSAYKLSLGLNRVGLPQAYDFVYCSLGCANWLVTELERIVLPNGRLILGCYGSDPKAKEGFHQKISELTVFGNIGTVIQNESHTHFAVWYQKQST